MKENSREEDIILLKDFIEGNFKRDKLENYKGSYKMGYFNYKDIQQAIEHILSDYKRVLKENEELKKYKEYYSLARQLVDNNYIQKQKVKEVIKELEDNIYRIKKQYSNGGENCNTVYLENLAQVKILKQILKEVE